MAGERARRLSITKDNLAGEDADHYCMHRNTRQHKQTQSSMALMESNTQLHLYLLCHSDLSLSLILSLMGAEKLQLIKDVNGGGEWLLILH